VIIVASLCWLIAPVIVQIIGRWQVCSYGVRDTINARRWSRAGCISGWIFGSAVAIIARLRVKSLRNVDEELYN